MYVKRFALCLALFSSCLLARADNLVVNGGFETGNFSGWTVTYASSGSNLGVDAVDPHTGIYSAYFAAEDNQYDSISQMLPTVAGMPYYLSFFLNETGTDPLSMDFQALWNGNVVYDSLGLGTNGYQLQSVMVTGIGNDTLTFRGYDSTDFDDFDDISVSTVVTPEPSSFIMLGTGLLGIAGAARRRFAK